ncbi:IclR family transcriptional regulator domain-containing protein [Jiangella asiatica]|uniref:Glycerol operon regulatory protein n=1 Tax=Jiangella asiatica TaxID=2530372 RepID=A0A4R5CZ11_9ACTN|nr:IclR family transcriptional regulator C-terminal domain-containing protein [Jiangella asiatica]TDE03113.1 winged helix-turn-helix transcriptional regulator [Jiangella asiatica]
MTADDKGADFVQSLARGLAVIRAFDAEHPELTLSDVARRTGLTRAAARRFLLTLEELGYVRTGGRLFALRPKILDLGYAYLSSLNLPEVALPHMERLVAQVHESSSVSVLDDDEIVYVARVPTKRIMSVNISVGTRFPAVSTSMGRVLLAGLPDDELNDVLKRTGFVQHTQQTIVDPDELRDQLEVVREQGWAAVDQELEQGLRALAVPIHDSRGITIAAMNVSVPAHSSEMTELTGRFLSHLQECALRVEADLLAVGT